MGTPLDGERSLKMYGQFSGLENYSGALQNIEIRGRDRFTAGAHALIRSEDSIAGTSNSAIMKIEFYSQAGAGHDSEFFLSENEVILANTDSPEDIWLYKELEGTSPSSSVEARVTLLFLQPESNPGGAVFIDNITFNTTRCLSDMNGDVALNFFDMSALLSAYNLQDPTAEVNGDGSFDYFDVSVFIAN